jgi:hypothetical protein
MTLKIVRLFCVVVLAAVAIQAQAAPLRYVFSEGDPLDYELKIATQIRTDTTREMGHGAERERHDDQMELIAACRLMPILIESNGVTKLRLVLDRIEQTSVVDGETLRRTFTREGLKQERNGKVWESTFFDVGPAPVFGGGAEPPQVQTVTGAELFDDPIVLHVARTGELREFDDRSLLRKVLPTLDLRRVLELILVPLTEDDSRTWARDVPVDSPAGNSLPDTVRQPVRYQRDGAMVRLEGTVRRENLRIPIEQVEDKWLLWTTYLHSVADSLQGEVEFAGGAIQRAQLQSRYECRLRTERKEDQGRRHKDDTLVSDLRIVFTRRSPTLAKAEVEGKNNN